MTMVRRRILGVLAMVAAVAAAGPALAQDVLFPTKPVRIITPFPVGGGPDGLHIDEHDNLWIACNQSNEILVLEPTQGRVIAKLGDFGGIDRNGAPIGFLWPNTFVVHGDDILVTNLSLDLGTAIPQLADELGSAPPVPMNLRTIDGPWARQVKVHTISKIKKRIPEGHAVPH